MPYVRVFLADTYMSADGREHAAPRVVCRWCGLPDERLLSDGTLERTLTYVVDAHKTRLLTFCTELPSSTSSPTIGANIQSRAQGALLTYDAHDAASALAASRAYHALISAAPFRRQPAVVFVALYDASRTLDPVTTARTSPSTPYMCIGY
jgi:hypothetical protein